MVAHKTTALQRQLNEENLYSILSACEDLLNLHSRYNIMLLNALFSAFVA